MGKAWEKRECGKQKACAFLFLYDKKKKPSPMGRKMRGQKKKFLFSFSWKKVFLPRKKKPSFFLPRLIGLNEFKTASWNGFLVFLFLVFLLRREKRRIFFAIKLHQLWQKNNNNPPTNSKSVRSCPFQLLLFLPPTSSLPTVEEA